MRTFVAEWVSDFQNEDAVYSSSTHGSFETAHARAIAESKAAGAMEWVAVKEYVWTGDKRTGQFELVARHYGDYDSITADSI